MTERDAYFLDLEPHHKNTFPVYSSLLHPPYPTAIMSSIANPLISSDNSALEAANRTSKLPNPRYQRSSIPPSESNGAGLSDTEGFPDDEVVGARGTDRNRPRDPMARAVPRVMDRVGEKVCEEFEGFLEKYAVKSCTAALSV